MLGVHVFTPSHSLLPSIPANYTSFVSFTLLETNEEYTLEYRWGWMMNDEYRDQQRTYLETRLSDASGDAKGGLDEIIFAALSEGKISILCH